MRFLPYLLVFSMTLPVIIWLLINNLVVRGTSTSFSGGDTWVLVSLGAISLLVFVVLANWLSRFIVKTQG